MIIKPLQYLFTASICLSSLLSLAQGEQIHIPTSKSIVGIWQQFVTVKSASGEVKDYFTGNYKVVNPDGTYYTFVNSIKGTSIGQYGTYKITSDSTLTEHIAELYLNPYYSGKDSFIKYHLPNANTLNLTFSFDGEQWNHETWKRVPPHKPKN
ncbi:hypothetical protein PK35_10250 [Tamlana nanhaiensis]|uniref:DUF4488 domain-containing protein n=1 Tax=Neotamlana nanhaiensis TaxID=1382798 RepID=A0A0D7W0A8_9FLAO|nr:DUF4488 domain-containing protein [Tamlana nanhaiensis]KJD32575.1 hypothetical protein PK35_10250 [Tamlana nanhaiensis]